VSALHATNFSVLVAIYLTYTHAYVTREYKLLGRRH